MLSPRSALLVVATLLGAGLAVPLTAGPASAATPAPVPVTQSAARSFGNGGPATQARVEARALTVAADGATLFYDRNSHQVRRVDPATSIVTVLAGTGAAPTSTVERCALAEGVPATEVPIEQLTALWAGTDGDLFASAGYQDACRAYGDVYRLDHLDETWHLALENPPTANCCSTPNGTYTAVAVEQDGDVYAFDSAHAVIRRIARGSAPSDQGVIVAGVLDSFGRSGDGGPATSAQLEQTDVLAVGPDGSLTFTGGGGTLLRRVDASGTITRIAGSGASPNDLTLNEGILATDARLQVIALTVGATDVYLQNRAGSGTLAVQAFPVGGTVRTVVGPATCYLSRAICPGQVLAQVGSDLLVADFGSIRSWPSDGSARQAPGVLFAGVDDSDGGGYSPDGAPLSRAFLPSISAVAVAPDGSLALATPRGIRVLRGLAATDTLSTLSTVPARTLAYTADGTLFATVVPAPGGPLTVATITPGGVVTPVLGGGSDPVSDGALGTSIRLPDLLVPALHTALDRDTGTLYFAVGTEHLWSLDPATGVVHRRAGDGGTSTLHDGADALTSSLSGRAPTALAVGSDHVVHVVTGNGMLRLDPAGTLHVADCTGGCPPEGVTVAPDGSLVFQQDRAIASRAPDGTVAQRLPGLTGPFAVLAGGRLVAPTFGSGGGGLLAVSDPLPTPVYPDPLPAVQVTPGPASITVSVTPAGDSPQRLRVYGTELPADGSAPTWTILLSDSVGGSTRTYSRLTSAGSGGRPVLHGITYRISVLATDSDDTTRVSVTSAAQRYDVEPAVDVTAPAAPALSLTNLGGNSVRLAVTLPPDPDTDRVVVRMAVGTQPPSSPTDGLPAAGFLAGGGSTGDVQINPFAATAFAAFTLDTSGNVSSATTVVRPAAALVAGDPVVGLGYLARAGATDIVWQERFVLGVRYAAGTTAPATMTDGTPVNQLSTADGTTAQVPVANGAKVAVSIFDFADQGQTTYRRVSFVLTGGLGSDSLTVAATPTVTSGQRPAVSVTFLRRSPTGVVAPRTGQNVVLFRRPVGTSSWLLVAGTYTGSTGRAAFTVPVPTGAVDYQVRSRTIGAVQIVGTRRTTVRQVVSANLSTTTIRRGSLVTVSGTVLPRRAVRVSLQRYVSGRWVTLVNVMSATTGGYRIAYRPASTGSYVLRVLSPASTAVLATASPNRTLRVT